MTTTPTIDAEPHAWPCRNPRCTDNPGRHLEVVITASGVRQVYPCCDRCRRKVGAQVKRPANIGELPIRRDNRTGERCERCGSAGGVETHHWAPQALFPDDFDRWPTAQLCTTCHRFWHSVVTPNLKRAVTP